MIATKVAKGAAKILLTAGLVGVGALALRGVDLRLVGAQMTALPHSTVLLALAVSFGQVLALATRLWTVFPHGRRPGWARVARAFGFGQLANACLPGRAGDVLKVVAISKDDGAADPGEVVKTAQMQAAAGVTDATGVMLADKALDFVTLGALVLVFAPALLVGVIAGAMHVAWIAGAAVPLAIAAVFALRRWWPRAFDRIRHAGLATRKAVRGLLTPKRLATALALGFASWIAEAASMMVLSSPLGVHLSLAQAIVGLLVLNLGIAVPVSVANVGAYEAATVVGLAPFGVPAGQALALGAMHHAVQLATIGGFALAFWLRDRLARARALRAPAVCSVEATTT